MNPTTPEVRQNLIGGSDQFGAVAVKAGPDRWGVMSPTNGGHWATDAEVSAWTPLAPAPAPADDAATAAKAVSAKAGPAK